MAKRSILDPEYGLLETDAGEKVALHARKGTLTFKPGLAGKAARFVPGGAAAASAAGQRTQKVKYKGEIVVTNQALWCGKLVGLFKKRPHVFAVAVYDPNYAESWVRNSIATLQQANTGSRWAVRLTRAQNIYFVTQVMTGKGIISKGFDLKLVRFNPKGHRTGFMKAMRNVAQALDSSFAGETWSYRLKKMAPGYEMSMGAMDGILANAQADSEQIKLRIPNFNSMVDAAATARAA